MQKRLPELFRGSLTAQCVDASFDGSHIFLAVIASLIKRRAALPSVHTILRDAGPCNANPHSLSSVPWTQRASSLTVSPLSCAILAEWLSDGTVAVFERQLKVRRDTVRRWLAQLLVMIYERPLTMVFMSGCQCLDLMPKHCARGLWPQA